MQQVEQKDSCIDFPLEVHEVVDRGARLVRVVGVVQSILSHIVSREDDDFTRDGWNWNCDSIAVRGHQSEVSSQVTFIGQESLIAVSAMDGEVESSHLKYRVVRTGRSVDDFRTDSDCFA